MSLRLKVESRELLPKNLEYSPKFECLGYSAGGTVLKVVKFVSKTIRKEKKKGDSGFNLRDMNSEKLFCPIKQVSFKEVN